MSKIQSLIFNRSYYNCPKAYEWMKKHNFKPIKQVHKTDKKLHYRIRSPKKNGKYKTIRFNNLISARVLF